MTLGKPDMVLTKNMLIKKLKYVSKDDRKSLLPRSAAELIYPALRDKVVSTCVWLGGFFNAGKV